MPNLDERYIKQHFAVPAAWRWVPECEMVWAVDDAGHDVALIATGDGGVWVYHLKPDDDPRTILYTYGTEALEAIYPVLWQRAKPSE